MKLTDFSAIISTLFLSVTPVKGVAEGILFCSSSDCTGAFRQDATRSNPAAMPYAMDSQLIGIYLDGRYANTGDTRPVETGDGHLLGSIGAESYRHLGKSTTVWGNARFLSGKIRDIRWNNAANYDLLGPYVIGDGVGGDITRRSYDFLGGYAGIAGQWSWGAQAHYRAAIDYRRRDPRDKIIVSDLDITLGGGYRLKNSPLAVGLAASARIYNQSADIEFYSPISDIKTYTMTGLGSYYPRFSGTSATNAAYTGVGFGMVASLFPTRDISRPVRAQIEAGHIKLRQYLRNFNNLELTYITTTHLAGEAGILFPGHPGQTFGATVRAEYNKKNGTENIVGASEGNNYPVIGERQNYSAEHFSASLSLPAEFCLNTTNRLNLKLSGSFVSSTEKLVDPSRQIAATGVIPQVDIAWNHKFSQATSLKLEGSLSHKFTSAGTISLTGLDMESEIGTTVDRLVSIATADITGWTVSARIDFPVVDAAGMFVKTSWQREVFSSGCGNADFVGLSVGLIL